MSLLGFDAIGRLALGQVRQNGQQTFSLAADPGTLALAPQSVQFRVAETVAPGVLSISPVVLAHEVLDKAEIGAMSLTSVSASLSVLQAAPFGLLTGSGSIKFTVFEAPPFGVLSLTPIDAPLSRTGADFDLTYGGIGHFLYEREKARKLAAITRNPPRPIDRRSAPQFQPLAKPYSAPIAPAVDMAAIQNQRTAAQAAAVQATKKRRELEAILLLAS